VIDSFHQSHCNPISLSQESLANIFLISCCQGFSGSRKKCSKARNVRECEENGEKRLSWSVVKCEKLQLKLQYKMASSAR